MDSSSQLPQTTQSSHEKKKNRSQQIKKKKKKNRFLQIKKKKNDKSTQVLFLFHHIFQKKEIFLFHLLIYLGLM
jgi:hypothetical protein